VNALADGEWHRLHPATPFLRGGLALLAIIGVLIVNLRDIVIDMVFGDSEGGRGPGPDGDALLWATQHNLLGLAILAVVVFLALLVGFYYVSWRMNTFRITEELVEVRSGVLNRRHRKGRLDRVQGVGVERPFLARLLGAARLEVNVAGQDANVRLDYLSTAAADALRQDILLLASGSRRAEAAEALAGNRGVVEQRVAELLAPELDPSLAPAESVVSMPVGRLLGSIVLSGSMFWLLVFTVGPIVAFSATGEVFALAVVLPGLLGVGSYVVRQFTKSLRYTIASTPDGIRIGFGLFSTSNETLPPGRIHAVEVSQPLLWRPAGWWRIRIDRASNSRADGAAGQANTTILPVGNRGDVRRVLGLIFTDATVEAIDAGLTGGGGFVTSPRRARVLRWFSVRRNGFARVGDLALFRTGAVLRALVVVPLARVQGVSVEQGVLERALRLATVRLHTVAGPVSPRLGALDMHDAEQFFADAADATVVAAATDRAHRWRAGEASA
jgi:putative membrane protein